MPIAPAEQLHAYLHWLKARGIRYPRRAEPVARVPASSSAPLPETVAASPALARVLFIGDVALTAPERELLDKMIAAMQLAAADVLITDHGATAGGLHDLIARRPALVIILGSAAAAALLPVGPVFSTSRGQCTTDPTTGLPLLMTHHPRDLLRTPADKRAAWADLQVGMAVLGLGGAR